MTGDNERRRVIAYVAWGEKYVLEACANATSASFLNIPLLLVTNKDSAGFVPSDHPFSSVEVVESFRSDDMLFKSCIYEIIPERFDIVLYVDTDVTIIGDVSFGFEMAEKFGIALSPATSYCLPSHHDFRRVMIDQGLPDAGQIQYNAGVQFFARGLDVKSVYDLYQKSAYEFSEKYRYRNARGNLSDQPFLSYALEKLGFNPYTLSINYCYRGLDAEPICGDIRIWHSRYPVPEDINTCREQRGAKRRYFRGKRVDMRSIYAELRKSE